MAVKSSLSLSPYLPLRSICFFPISNLHAKIFCNDASSLFYPRQQIKAEPDSVTVMSKSLPTTALGKTSAPSRMTQTSLVESKC